MKINKQLFEDVLAGKLKGTFVMGNGNKYFSSSLHRNYNNFRDTHPYEINLLSYTPEGRYSEDVTQFSTDIDIVKFIPDTDMKENEKTIEIPDGKIVDWDESKKQEKIVFKKKDTKPRSWEEYCENHRGGFAFISTGSRVSVTEVKYPSNESLKLDPEYSKHALPSKELAEAFLAMMQVMSLRQAWIGDWEPDWRKSISCIVIEDNTLLTATEYTSAQHVLSFPTLEMTKEFMNCFKDLLEIAKPLI